MMALCKLSAIFISCSTPLGLHAHIGDGLSKLFSPKLKIEVTRHRTLYLPDAFPLLLLDVK